MLKTSTFRVFHLCIIRVYPSGLTLVRDDLGCTLPVLTVFCTAQHTVQPCRCMLCLGFCADELQPMIIKLLNSRGSVGV